MQDRSIDDRGPENEIVTFFMNNHRFTNKRIVENKEAELHGG
jgi:hypothetical protein